MIYYRDKKLKKTKVKKNKTKQPPQKKWLHVLEDDIITIKKNNIDLMSLAQRMYFFTGSVPNDRHCACFSTKSLSMGCIYFETSSIGIIHNI